MSETTIPHNLEAEEAVLGAMLADPKCIDTVLARKLSDRDYYRPSHRMIHRVIMDLHERGEGTDFLTVINELKHRKELDDAGGSATIATLEQRTPALGNVGAYADEVIDQAQRRCVLDTGLEIQRLAYEETDKSVGSLSSHMSLLVDRAMSYLRRSLRSGRTSEDLAEWAVKHLIEPDTDRQWFPHFMPTLQEHTGGIASGQLMVVGAESAVGKSVFGQGYVLAAPPEARVGVITTEMPEEELQLRFISTITGISISRMMQPRLDGTFDLNEDEQDRYIAAADELNQRNYTIHTTSSLEEIEQIQRTEKYEMLVVDHIHRLKDSEDYQGLVRIVRSMKNLALVTKCAVVALAQFNRASEFEGDSLPTLRRLKGGNVIEEESDLVLLLHRDKDEHGFRTPEGQVLVVKNRSGVSGYSIPAVMLGASMKWEERS